MRFYAVLVLALLMTGCGASQLPISSKDKALLERGGPAAVIASHEEWSADVRKAASQHEAQIGMTRLQARMAWGGGSLRQYEGGGFIDRQYRERWFYDCGSLLVVAYFLDDGLVACKAFDEHDGERPLARGDFGYLLPCDDVRSPASEEFAHRIIWVHPRWDGRLPPIVAADVRN